MFNKIVHRIRSVPLSGSHYSVDFFVMELVRCNMLAFILVFGDC